MVNPKSLLFQMYRYWPVIEALTRHSREWPAFEVSAILALIAHNAGGDVLSQHPLKFSFRPRSHDEYGWAK